LEKCCRNARMFEYDGETLKKTTGYDWCLNVSWMFKSHLKTKNGVVDCQLQKMIKQSKKVQNLLRLDRHLRIQYMAKTTGVRLSIRNFKRWFWNAPCLCKIIVPRVWTQYQNGKQKIDCRRTFQTINTIIFIKNRYWRLKLRFPLMIQRHNWMSCWLRFSITKG